MSTSQLTNLYGVILEFKDPETLTPAAKKAYDHGFRKLDAFTPYPVEGLAPIIGFEKDRVALLSLVGGILGGSLGFLMQWYCNVFDYPINVGGRPDFSWPAFVPVTFELSVLGAALSASFGMLFLNGLPKLWHPVFNDPEFSRASRDRFFLCIQAEDGLYHLDGIRKLFEGFDFIGFREVSCEE